MIGGMDEWRGHAVLQVAVPQLEAWIRERVAFYDDAFISAEPDFAHAHITLLAPMYQWSADAIAATAANTRAFDFVLREVSVFPDGFIHLVPDPDSHFRRLARRLWDAHPEVVPFGAPAPDPHLTLDLVSDRVSVAGTRAALDGIIPAHCRAHEIELVWYEAGHCHTIDRWTLAPAD